MEHLITYYNEHAAQARQHEDQRERMTNIILSISGVLVGLTTFSELSIWALSASLPIMLLGIFGFFFAGKHYERAKFHTAIMKEIREEIDRVSLDKKTNRMSLSKIREAGSCNHYSKFVWINIFSLKKEKVEKNMEYVCKMRSPSTIAKCRIHIFWEFLHILIAILGLGLTIAILIKENNSVSQKNRQINIVNCKFK